MQNRNNKVGEVYVKTVELLQKEGFSPEESLDAMGNIWINFLVGFLVTAYPDDIEKIKDTFFNITNVTVKGSVEALNHRLGKDYFGLGDSDAIVKNTMDKMK